MTAGIFGFTPAHQKKILHPKILADFRQHIAVHERGAKARQLTLGIVEMIEEMARDREFEHGITQKFQPFVVRKRILPVLVQIRTVCQRFLKQILIPYRNTERLF